MIIQTELKRELKRMIMERELAIKGLVKEIYECKQFSELNRLNVLIGQKIREQKKAIDELEKLRLDSRNNVIKNELEDETDNIKVQLDNNYTVLKKANLFAKNNIIQHSKNSLFERNNLDDDNNLNEDKLRKRRGDQFLINKTSSITDNLFQITKLMSEQVNQSDASLQALVNSSSMVTETQEEIKLMGSHLVSSKTLLTKYGRRECTDKILIFLALGFFLACVLFCVTRRIL